MLWRALAAAMGAAVATTAPAHVAAAALTSPDVLKNAGNSNGNQRAEPIYPKPLASEYHTETLRFQCNQAWAESAGATGSAPLLPWELETSPLSEPSPVPGPALRRAMRRSEATICSQGAATDNHAGERGSTVRWTLHLDSWSETLVDAVPALQSIIIASPSLFV